MTTDVIVGFPGETEEDFDETLSAVREIGFEDAFTFKFSLRDGTPATRFPERNGERRNIERSVRAAHRDRASRRSRQQSQTTWPASRGFDRERSPPRWSVAGRTRDFKTVIVPGETTMIGNYATVELTGTTGSTFTGTFVRERSPLPVAV